MSETILTRRYDFSKGRRGALVESSRKTRITIMLDDEILDHFRTLAEDQGIGYQTMINAVLRSHVATSKEGDSAPLTVGALREILRQELRTTGE